MSHTFTTLHGKAHLQKLTFFFLLVHGARNVTEEARAFKPCVHQYLHHNTGFITRNVLQGKSHMISQHMENICIQRNSCVQRVI
ncbi:hypothetical protein V6Z11_D01G002900 [Gossypium hirsutum]